MELEGVTVVVLNYNGASHLRECFTSLREQKVSGPVTVVLWDNGSQDQSLELMQREFPEVRILLSSENLGFARAMNAAARHASTRWVVFLNNDVRVLPGWLEELTAVARQAGPRVAAVGSRLLVYANPSLVNHAGGVSLTIGGAFDEGLYEPSASFEERPAFYATGVACGGAMLVPRDTFLALGGFDETFFMYFEDADYCLRAWMQGFEVFHAANARLLHKIGGTVGPLGSPFRVYWGQRNRIVMAGKTRSGPRVFGALVFATGWGLVQSLSADGKTRAAALRGTRDGWKVLWTARSARAQLQANRVVSDHDLLRRRVLVGVRAGFQELRRQRRLRASVETAGLQDP